MRKEEVEQHEGGLENIIEKYYTILRTENICMCVEECRKYSQMKSRSAEKK